MIRTIQTAQIESGHRLIMACDLPVVGHSLWIMDFDHNGKPTMDWQKLPTPLFVDIKEKDKILPVCDNTTKTFPEVIAEALSFVDEIVTGRKTEETYTVELKTTEKSGEVEYTTIHGVKAEDLPKAVNRIYSVEEANQKIADDYNAIHDDCHRQDAVSYAYENISHLLNKSEKKQFKNKSRLQEAREQKHDEHIRSMALLTLGFDPLIISILLGKTPSYPHYFKSPRTNLNLNIDHRTVGKSRNNHEFLNSIFVGGQNPQTGLAFKFPLPTHVDAEIPNSCKPFNEQKEISNINKKLDYILDNYPEEGAANDIGGQ